MKGDLTGGDVMRAVVAVVGCVGSPARAAEGREPVRQTPTEVGVVIVGRRVPVLPGVVRPEPREDGVPSFRLNQKSRADIGSVFELEAPIRFAQFLPQEKQRYGLAIVQNHMLRPLDREHPKIKATKPDPDDLVMLINRQEKLRRASFRENDGFFCLRHSFEEGCLSVIASD